MDWFATNITHTVLFGLPVFLYLPLGILSQIHIRGGYSDPARNGFNWFKAALWLTFAHLVFFVIYIIVNVTAHDIRPMAHLGGITSLLLNFSNLVLLFSIAYLAVGADKIDNPHGATRTISCVFINIVRGILGACAIITAISFIFFRYIDAKQYAKYYGGSFGLLTTSDRRTASAFRWMGLAIDALLVIVAIYTTVFSVLARNQARKYAVSAGTGLPAMRRVWDFLIPATGITIVTTAWNLAYSVLGNTSILYFTNSSRFDGMGLVVGSLMIVDVIISKWVVLAVCVIIFVMGKKKEDGLWSIPPTESGAPETSVTKDEDGQYSV